jgi:sugar lactone lactonase YvrE
MQGEFTEPNGLAFNKEQNILYWNDLVDRVIKQFDFDLGTGTLCNYLIYVKESFCQ